MDEEGRNGGSEGGKQSGGDGPRWKEMEGMREGKRVEEMKGEGGNGGGEGGNGGGEGGKWRE